jgi:hypothetical protein
VIFLDPNPKNLDQLKVGWNAYQEYLKSVSDKFPPGALAFATASWHYDVKDCRCPHDAWIESLTVLKRSAGEHERAIP